MILSDIRFGSVLILALALPAVGRAEPTLITGEAIRQTVAGATINLDTPIGTVLPIDFHADGTLSGKAGGLAFFLGAATDKGRWWIAGHKLCQKWTKWFDAETSCLVLRREGTRLHWRRDDGKEGTATIAPAVVVAEATNPATLANLGGPKESADSTPTQVPLAVQVTPPPEKRPAKTTTLATLPAPLSPPAHIRQPAPLAPVSPVAPVTPVVVPAPPAALQPRVRDATVSVPTFVVVNVRSDDVLNIRSAPNAEASIVGSIPYSGTGIRLTGPCQQDWCPVKFARTAGWVNRFYIAVGTPVTISSR